MVSLLCSHPRPEADRRGRSLPSQIPLCSSQDELQIRAVCSSQTLSACHKPPGNGADQGAQCQPAHLLPAPLPGTRWEIRDILHSCAIPTGHGPPCALHAFPNPQTWHRAIPVSPRLPCFPPLQLCVPQRGSLLFPERSILTSLTAAQPHRTRGCCKQNYPNVYFSHWNFHLP